MFFPVMQMYMFIIQNVENAYKSEEKNKNESHPS